MCFNISCLIFPLPLDLPNSLFSSGLLTKIFYEFLICPMRATRPDHLVILDLITLLHEEPNFSFHLYVSSDI
jgi:hypothetical protein